MSLPIGSSNLRIDELISSRCNELDIGPVELVRRCGYKNLAKGLRRLEELRGGEFKSTRGLIHALPQALDLPAEVVQKAVEDTTRQLHEAHEAAWRGAFKPHAIILTDRKIPHPIFVAAMIGVDELLRIDFPPFAAAEMIPDLAIEGIRLKLARWNRDFNRRKGLGSYQLPAFGRPLGFVVNYSPDHAGWFDPLGNVVVVLSKAHRIGHVTLNLEGSSIPLSAVLKIGSSADDMIITDHEGKLARGEICRHEAEILSLRPYCPQCPSAPHYKLGKKISYLFGCGSLWPKKTSWGAGAVGARGAVTVWDRIDEDDQAISSAQRYNDACAFLALRFYCPSAPPH